jgi:hypothetical protein
MGSLFERFIVVGLLCIGLAAICLAPVHAGTTGSIQGYLTDEAGHEIVGAIVSASSPSGDFTTRSGPSGFYSLNGLPLDTYTLTFSKDGYQAVSIPGVSTAPDQPNRVNTRLSTGLKSLGHVYARAVTSLLQPTVTADTYLISQQRLYDIAGTPQDLGAFSLVFNSLPGVTGGTIRAGASNDVGYQLDGIDATRIDTGQYLNFAPTLNGVRSVQLSTGGYDVSEGNTNSGIFNEIVNRGTYPGSGRATMRINSPLYGHELSFDYGSASPNNRYSYYVAVGGLRDAVAYGDTSAILPLNLGNGTFDSITDTIFNFYYHFGQGNSNELQLLMNIRAETFYNNYLALPSAAPYASNNGSVQATFDPFGFEQPATFLSNYITLQPSQAAYQQNTGAPDSLTLSSSIDKINFKRQLSPSSFAEVRGYMTYLNQANWMPYGSGAFTDSFYSAWLNALGAAFDYTNQLSSKHELSIGGDGVYFSEGGNDSNPSLEPFHEPLEALGCPSLASYLATNSGLPGFPSVSTPGVGGCYIGPLNNALNNTFIARGFPNPGLPTDPAHAPLDTFVNDGFVTEPPVHRWDLYVKDRWQPSARLTLTLGLRWDKESIGLPSDAAELNTTYYFDDHGNLVTLPGQPIGTDVTQPQQISPRIAASYEITARDALRMSYGKNIEFVPTQVLEGAYPVPSSLANCNIANGCFIPLPGFGVTNHITNLYQQALIDLNTNEFPQYTPVLPQTAVNVDFSYEHDFGDGVELRVTPYYRKGTNYAVFDNQPLLFTLPSGTPVFGPGTVQNGGINQSTGVEFALQRTAPYGFSGLLAATYDNTLANYDSDFFPNVNAAVLASGHFFHVTYVAPISGALNIVYNTRKGLYAATTISYESGFRYGVGTKTFIYGANGQPEQVLNTDLVNGSFAYYFTDPTNPGTIDHPNITGSRGTPEGSDPGTLFGPPIAVMNLTVSQALGHAHNVQAGLRVVNLFGNYSPTSIPANQWYVPQGLGSYGPGSGFNRNQCAPGQTLGCQPFSYNYSAFPYEAEPDGPPRVYTFFVSLKY